MPIRDDTITGGCDSPLNWLCQPRKQAAYPAGAGCATRLNTMVQTRATTLEQLPEPVDPGPTPQATRPAPPPQPCAAANDRSRDADHRAVEPPDQRPIGLFVALPQPCQELGIVNYAYRTCPGRAGLATEHRSGTRGMPTYRDMRGNGCELHGACDAIAHAHGDAVATVTRRAATISIKCVGSGDFLTTTIVPRYRLQPNKSCSRRRAATKQHHR